MAVLNLMMTDDACDPEGTWPQYFQSISFYSCDYVNAESSLFLRLLYVPLNTVSSLTNRCLRVSGSGPILYPTCRMYTFECMLGAYIWLVDHDIPKHMYSPAINRVCRYRIV